MAWWWSFFNLASSFEYPTLEEHDAENYELVELLTWLARLRAATPPPLATASTNGGDPRDGDGWIDAVSWQGVRPPAYGPEFLASTHWELCRAAWLTGRCAECKGPAHTALHHLTYARLGNERPEDVLELCWECHARHHIQRAA